VLRGTGSRGLQIDLTNLARRQLRSVRIQYAHLCVPHWSSHTPLMPKPLVTLDGSNTQPLTHAIGHDEVVRADELDPAVHQVRGHWRSPLNDRLDTRQVSLINTFKIRNPLEHGRSAEE